MKVLTGLWPYLWRYRRDLILGILFSIGVYGVSLVGPWLLGRAIDALTRQGSHLDSWLLARYALLMAAVAVIANVFSFLQHWRLFLVGNRVEYDFRNDFFRHLQTLEPAFFQERKTGDIVSLATNDLAIIRTLVGAGSINFFGPLVALIAGLSLMFVLDTRLALYTVLILPLMTLVYVVLAKPSSRRFERMQDQYSVLSSMVQENIAGVRVVKAYAQEQAEVRKFGQLCAEYSRLSLRYMRLAGTLSPLMYVIFGLAVMVMLLVGGNDVIQHRITLGTLIQFNGYLLMLNWPVVVIGWLITIIGQADGAMTRLMAVQNRLPRIADGPGTLPITTIAGEIRFEHVTLILDQKKVLDDISLHVPVGSTLAIVGAIGSGKSSVINVLLRMFDAQHGRILIDGVDIRHIPLETLRRNIGLVPQETLLFSETLSENILYGVEQTTPDEAQQLVLQASSIAQLAKDVDAFPHGYDTVLGERGITLSGGQKQRAAIARALAKNPRILILDDALSAVDTHTEDDILSGLRQVMRERTSIIVSHRISTVRHADHIVVLASGAIAETGTHRALIAHGGLYAAMYRRQLLAEEMEGSGMSTPIEADDDILGKAYDGQLMRRLLPYVTPYRKDAALATTLLLLMALADLAGPYLTKIAIDQHIATGHMAGLSTIAMVYGATLLFSFTIRYAHQLVMTRLGQNVIYDLRMTVFGHLQRMSISFYDHNKLGRLLTRVMGDVATLNEMLTSSAVAVFGDIFTLVAIMVMLLLLNWQLALISFVAFPILFVISLYLRNALRLSYRTIRKHLSRINAFAAESVTGMSIIQLFTRERRNYAQFEALNRDYCVAFNRSVFQQSIFGPLVNLVNAAITASIIWYGGGQAIHQALTIGTLVAFLQYVGRFFLPINDLADKFTALQAAMAAAERVFRLLDEPEAVANPAHPVTLPSVRGEVEFRDVWFTYAAETQETAQDAPWVLRGLSLHIKPGESVAIVGATGAGKSSIISLLARFYDIQKGAILVDGVDIRELDQQTLRRHVGIVLQDSFLFSGTISSNIRLHEQGISDDDIGRAAQLVNADSFINRLPGGFEETVRERGAGLSVGQKQLLTFARAMAFNPEICLVLDEATSNVDTETEILIRDALLKLIRGRTSIVIAHRLSTIRHVDRIIVLNRGQIVEMGSHDELIGLRGAYFRLYQLQYQT